jgi:hypothetical protein
MPDKAAPFVPPRWSEVAATHPVVLILPEGANHWINSVNTTYSDASSLMVQSLKNALWSSSHIVTYTNQQNDKSFVARIPFEIPEASTLESPERLDGEQLQHSIALTLLTYIELAAHCRTLGTSVAEYVESAMKFGAIAKHNEMYRVSRFPIENPPPGKNYVRELEMRVMCASLS